MGFSTGAKSTQDIFVDMVNAIIGSGVWYNVDTTQGGIPSLPSTVFGDRRFPSLTGRG